VLVDKTTLVASRGILKENRGRRICPLGKGALHKIGRSFKPYKSLVVFEMHVVSMGPCSRNLQIILPWIGGNMVVGKICYHVSHILRCTGFYQQQGIFSLLGKGFFNEF